MGRMYYTLDTGHNVILDVICLCELWFKLNVFLPLNPPDYTSNRVAPATKQAAG